MKLRVHFTGVLLLAAASTLVGCTLASRKKTQGGMSDAEAKVEEGKGDAFLFDVKIYRNGKKNSVRLDVYRTGDSLSLFARGYLGRGVLKGIILSDSLTAYFPTENEFFSGKIADLLKNSCADDFAFEKLIIDLFARTPVELEYPLSQFYLTIVKEDKKVRRYRLECRECPESMELTYDWNESRFILKKLEYSSRNKTLRIKADRRKHRLNIDIPVEKFLLSIPEAAERIYP